MLSIIVSPLRVYQSREAYLFFILFYFLATAEITAQPMGKIGAHIPTAEG